MMRCLNGCIISGLLLGTLSLAQPFYAFGQTMKTYVKQYSIFTFENQDYLCEPYQVKKDDWLYKIFRQKGEISGEDFPEFLNIFKRLNPKLSNIDAIEPGHQILIPLKQVSRKAYKEKQRGIVEVPVLEFSTQFKQEKLTAFVKNHTIQRGDTVSTLLDKAFLQKGGAVSDTGKKVFTHLNPDVRDLNKIYLGSRVRIPDPSLLAQPWFQKFLATGQAAGPPTSQDKTIAGQPAPRPLPTLPELAPGNLARLKRYTQLVQGALQHQGQMVFPGKSKGNPKVLDLTRTPLLTENDGSKTLILPQDTGPQDLDTDLIQGMKQYWKELQIQELNQALAKGSSLMSLTPPMDKHPEDASAIIKTVLEPTAFVFQLPSPVPIQINGVGISVDLARITHDNRPDILVNPGTVYGAALTNLADKGIPILTLSPGMTTGEILILVFSKLGFTTWKNPAFNTDGRVSPLKGIYAVCEKDKFFITGTALSARATAFMDAEGIIVIRLKGK
jgi:hypothetical protein